jgi:uncharacterized OB-fold protein
MSMQEITPTDPDSAPWWDGIAQGELRYQLCYDCDSAIFYPRSLCPECFSSRLIWKVAAGGGTVYAFTVVHRSPDRRLATEVPYVLALVDVDEGFRMLSRLIDATPGEVKVGQRVRLTFYNSPDGRNLPCFRMVLIDDEAS